MFLNNWKKNQNNVIFHDIQKIYAIQMLVFIKGLIEQDTFIHLSMVYGYFHAVTVGLRNYNTDCVVLKA